MTRVSRRLRASLGLVLAVGLVGGCGNVPGSASPTSGTSGATATPSARTAAPPSGSLPPKPMPPLAQARLVGWLDASPAIASFARPGDGWTISVPTSGGWDQVGTLPAGSTPVTDGASVANVVDPEVATAIAVLGAHGTRQVDLPAGAWLEPWTGLAMIEPLARGGYMLRGAGALAIVSRDGDLSVSPLPAGYVALAPTAEEGTWLLASSAALDEPGALSESTYFSAYLWSEQDPDRPPVEVLDEVVRVDPSDIGLALLRRADGSWWSLGADGATVRLTDPTRRSTRLSPDGRWLVSLGSPAGCRSDESDPCLASVESRGGSGSQQISGPTAGVAFDGGKVAVVLARRDALHLPWRLLFGPAESPAVLPLE